MRDLHRAVGVEVKLRRGRLCEPQPAEVIVELPVRVDARLDAKLAGAKFNGLMNTPHELFLIEVVSLG